MSFNTHGARLIGYETACKSDTALAGKEDDRQFVLSREVKA